MHDGALIVRNRRIYAAGCYLPLSKTDLNKDLGTRHRAALGVSEVSDAIVIVVSEETGTISIAVGGDLTRNYNYSSLKQALLKYLVPVENAAGKRRLFGAKGTTNDKK
jgi:diadenylate cyclase